MFVKSETFRSTPACISAISQTSKGQLVAVLLTSLGACQTSGSLPRFKACLKISSKIGERCIDPEINRSTVVEINAGETCLRLQTCGTNNVEIIQVTSTEETKIDKTIEALYPQSATQGLPYCFLTSPYVNRVSPTLQNSHAIAP